MESRGEEFIDTVAKWHWLVHGIVRRNLYFSIIVVDVGIREVSLENKEAKREKRLIEKFKLKSHETAKQKKLISK